MAEAFSFAEGTAQFITGGATSLMLYATDVRGSKMVGYHKYRPPRSTVYQYIETGRDASVSFGQVYSQKDLGAMFDGATAGGVHVRFIHNAAGTNGTLWFYSGVLEAATVEGREGDVMAYSVQGNFQSWSES